MNNKLNKVEMEDKKNRRYGKIINYSGSILAIISVIFVFFRLKSYLTIETLDFFNFKNVLIIAATAFTYGIVSITLGYIWRNILAANGVIKSYGWAVTVYGMSQIAKYIPGNIFHFAGRQAIGMGSGVSGKALAKSTFWELALLVFSGGLFSIILIPLFFNLNSINFIYFFISFLVVSFSTAWVIKKFFGLYFSKAFIAQIIFLLFSGSVFLFLISLVKDFTFLELETSRYWLFLFVPAAFVTAWLIGLVTPGAPAGIGVREIVLIYLLGSVFDNASIILSVMISRIVTVLGDVIFYIIAFLMRRVYLND